MTPIVWSYWQGDKPKWVEECLKTIRLHSRDVIVLDDLSWNRIWEKDRDLMPHMARLTLPQKSDFIRAYVLKHYGGIWCDIDCIALKDPICFLDGMNDFAAYVEAGNTYASGLIGSAKNGRIVSRAYADMCQLIRSDAELGWMTLAQAFHRAIKAGVGEVKTLWTPDILPICWNEHRKFIEKTTPFIHAKKINPNAVTYMMAGESFRRDKEIDADDILFHGDTLWYYLMFLANRSLMLESPYWSHFYGSFLERIPSFMDEPETAFLISQIKPGDMCIDVGVGRGKSTAAMAMVSQNVFGISIWNEASEGGRTACEAHLRSTGAIQNITLLENRSVDAAKGFPPNIANVILIDAAHDEQSAREDFNAWKPILKPGGTMLFHDVESAVHPGVSIALNQMDWEIIGQAGHLRAYQKPD